VSTSGGPRTTFGELCRFHAGAAARDVAVDRERAAGASARNPLAPLRKLGGSSRRVRPTATRIAGTLDPAEAEWLHRAARYVCSKSF